MEFLAPRLRPDKISNAVVDASLKRLTMLRPILPQKARGFHMALEKYVRQVRVFQKSRENLNKAQGRLRKNANKLFQREEKALNDLAAKVIEAADTISMDRELMERLQQ